MIRRALGATLALAPTLLLGAVAVVSVLFLPLALIGERLRRLYGGGGGPAARPTP